MATPTLTEKKKKGYDTVPRTKKLNTARDNVDRFDRCRQKHRKIKKHLRNENKLEISFDLDEDKDKALRTLGKKYEKTLDEIIEEIMTPPSPGDAKNKDPSIDQQKEEHEKNNPPPVPIQQTENNES